MNSFRDKNNRRPGFIWSQLLGLPTFVVQGSSGLRQYLANLLLFRLGLLGKVLGISLSPPCQKVLTH